MTIGGFSALARPEQSREGRGERAWLPDGDSQILRSYVFGPSGFWTMALLRYAAKFDPFLSLDCAPIPSTLAHSKERKGSNFAIWQPWQQVHHPQRNLQPQQQQQPLQPRERPSKTPSPPKESTPPPLPTRPPPSALSVTPEAAPKSEPDSPDGNKGWAHLSSLPNLKLDLDEFLQF